MCLINMHAILDKAVIQLSPKMFDDGIQVTPFNLREEMEEG